MAKHMKTLTVPNSWPVARKSSKFIIRPMPGKPFKTSMPLALVLKNLLKYGKTMKEIKSILHDKEILVDGARKKNPKELVGLMDTLSIPSTKEHYRMIITNKGKLNLLNISDKEASQKICRINGKTLIKKGAVQLNLSDGRNVIVKKDEHPVGASVLLEVPSQKIIDVFAIEKGNYVFLIRGSHIGEHGVIKDIKENKMIIKTQEEDIETQKPFIYVVGKEKPAVKIE